MTADPQDPTVVALGRSLVRTTRKLDALEDIVRTLVTSISAASPQAGGAPETADVRSWLLADDPAQAVLDLADLVTWMDRVYVRFSRSTLSTCWLWHPEVVEELWWLRGAHADAYDPEHGSWLRVGDWHDRQRPGVVARVNAVLGKCSLSRHVTRNGRPPDVVEPAPAPLGDHHNPVAVAWVTTGTAGPTPTASMLAEAGEHEKANHHR
jgi:hypothetical protein